MESNQSPLYTVGFQPRDGVVIPRRFVTDLGPGNRLKFFGTFATSRESPALIQAYGTLLGDDPDLSIKRVSPLMVVGLAVKEVYGSDPPSVLGVNGTVIPLTPEGAAVVSVSGSTTHTREDLVVWGLSLLLAEHVRMDARLARDVVAGLVAQQFSSGFSPGPGSGSGDVPS